MRQLQQARDPQRGAEADRHAHGVAEGHRARREVGAQGGPGGAAAQRLGQVGFRRAGTQFAAAAGPVGVAHRRGQLARKGVDVRGQATGGTVAAEQRLFAGAQGLQRVTGRLGRLALLQRVGDRHQHACGVVAEHRMGGWIGVQLGHRGELQPDPFGQLQQHAERFHRATVGPVTAQQGLLQRGHRFGQRRHIGVVMCLLSGQYGEAGVHVRQRLAFGPVALQRPCRQREHGEQQAAAEDQRGTAERFVQRGRRRRGDHQQDHAGHADPRGVYAEHHQHAAEETAGGGGDQDRQQVAADQKAHQRGEARGQRRQQQLPQALPIRSGLIGEHRVQRTGRHAQSDLRIAHGQADAQRQHHRSGIAHDHPQRHVRPLDDGQAFDRMGA